jgi:hypothetical protein
MPEGSFFSILLVEPIVTDLKRAKRFRLGDLCVQCPATTGLKERPLCKSDGQALAQIIHPTAETRRRGEESWRF